jgi:hypothetical protein
MKCLIFSVLLAFVLVNLGFQSWAGSEPKIEVFFSPQGGCTEAVVRALDHTTNNALVQAYSFTSAPIAKALVDAHKRGIKVQVILDNSQRTEKYSSADFVADAGIPTYIDARHAIIAPVYSGRCWLSRDAGETWAACHGLSGQVAAITWDQSCRANQAREARILSRQSSAATPRLRAWLQL